MYIYTLQGFKITVGEIFSIFQDIRTSWFNCVLAGIKQFTPNKFGTWIDRRNKIYEEENVDSILVVKVPRWLLV